MRWRSRWEICLLLSKVVEVMARNIGRVHKCERYMCDEALVWNM
jgi:hypothetical protein